MKIEYNTKNKEVEVGDIVLYDEEVCIVMLETETYIESSESPDSYKKAHPVGVVNLRDGKLINAFMNIETVRDNVELLCKNDRARLILGDKEEGD